MQKRKNQIYQVLKPGRRNYLSVSGADIIYCKCFKFKKQRWHNYQGGWINIQRLKDKIGVDIPITPIVLLSQLRSIKRDAK